MPEFIETFIAIGEQENELFKTGHLQVSREARLNPFHPQHQATLRALGDLVISAVENGLEQPEVIWAATYDTGKGVTIDSNTHIECIPHAGSVAISQY